MPSEQRHDQKESQDRSGNQKWDEFARAAGNRKDVSREEAEKTPPGGDVRTAYSADDRAPGEAVPKQKKA